MLTAWRKKRCFTNEEGPSVSCSIEFRAVVFVGAGGNLLPDFFLEYEKYISLKNWIFTSPTPLLFQKFLRHCIEWTNGFWKSAPPFTMRRKRPMKRDDGKQITKVSLLFQVTFLFHFWFLNKDPEALLKYVEGHFELKVGVIHYVNKLTKNIRPTDI